MDTVPIRMSIITKYFVSLKKLYVTFYFDKIALT